MPALAVDAGQLLHKLGDAEQQTSFSGTFVYGVAGGLSAYQLWQQAGGPQVLQRLVRLDGKPAEAALANGVLRCLSDDALRDVARDGNWPRLDPDRLGEGYEIRSLGESRVAGRAVDAVALVPRDQHRYGLELYLDRQTTVPLKALLFSENGQLLKRYQFTHFSAESVSSEAIEPGADCQTAPEVSEPAASAVAWTADWAPPGFRLLNAGLRQRNNRATPLYWLTYGDGLATFTAFVEPATGQAPADERTQLGPTSAVSKRMMAGGQDVMVTVVGEIPLGTAERIALSVRPQAEQSR